jgi:putative two-component system response regulator
MPRTEAVSTVFLVDDNYADANLLRLAISEIDPRIRTETFLSGADVLESLEKNVSQPDLMIMDLHMNSISGFELLGHLIAKRLKKFPVYVFSGSLDEREKQKAYEAGADDFLSKQTNYGDLLQLLRGVLP